MRQAYDYWQDQPGNCFGVDRPRRAAPPRVCRPRHDAVLSISRSSLSLAPDGYVFALPAERASTSSSIARMPPARAGNADTRDNLVFDRVDSALFGNETSRRPRTARVRLPMATSAVRTSNRGGSFSRRRVVRKAWHHHRRCVLTHELSFHKSRTLPSGAGAGHRFRRSVVSAFPVKGSANNRHPPSSIQ